MSKPGSSVSNAYNNKILDLARYNGRVNLMEEPDPAIQFQLAEKVAIKKLHKIEDIVDAKRIIREIRILRNMK